MTNLKRGSTGPEVKLLQDKLKALNYELKDVEGDFGPSTEAAVKKFQKLKELKEDGIVGPRTMSALPTNELDLPLHLFEILEEEHISLYNKLEETTVINLKHSESNKAQAKNGESRVPEPKVPEPKGTEPAGRSVTSCLNWDFHPGHIKDWEKFKDHLRKSRLTDPQKVCPHKRILSRLRNKEAVPTTHLRDILSRETVETWNTETDALATLNHLLGQRFYCRADFKHVKFGESTEKLFELYPMKDWGQRVFPEELRQLNRLLLEDLFPEHLESIREIRLAAIYQVRHESQVGPEKVSAALCLSGGGIRSGTFALGLLQGLARHNLLKEFDYLSTVSGGGYIGAWLTAWIHRHPKPLGLPGVTTDLTNATPDRKIDPDPPALRHLREYSNFLTPKAGLLSADTWAFVAIYVRNLILNWSVIIPLLLAFLLIPRLSVAVVLADPFERKLVLFIVGCLLVIFAVTYIGLSRPSLRPQLIQKWPKIRDKMSQRGFLWYCLLPLVVAGSLLTTYWAWTAENLVWWYFPLVAAGLAAVPLYLLIWFIGTRKEWVAGAALFLTGIFVGLLGLAAIRSSGYWRLMVGVGLVAVTLLILTAVYPNWKALVRAAFVILPSIFVGTFIWAVINHHGYWWVFLLAGIAAVGLLFFSLYLSRKDFVLGGVVLIITGGLGGLLVWAVTNLIRTQLSPKTLTSVDIDVSWATELYVSYAVPVFLLLFMMAATAFAGISSHLLGVVTDEDREWWARFSAWMLISAGAWTAFSSLVLFGPLGLLEFPRLLAAVGGLSGVVALVVGQSAKTAATSEKVAQGGIRGYVSSYLLPLLAVLFLAVFVSGLSLLTSTLTPPLTRGVDQKITPLLTRLPPTAIQGWLLKERRVNREKLDGAFKNANPVAEQSKLPVEISDTKIGDLLAVGKTPPAEQRQTTDAKVQHLRSVHFPRWWFFVVLMALLSTLGILLARVINLNLFSLHNSYRNRLIRGFLAASRGKKLRGPNPFTGFDPADNVPMHGLRPALLHEVDFKDLDGFARKLKAGGALAEELKSSALDKKEAPAGDVEHDHASAFLYGELSKKGKAAVDDPELDTPLSPSQRSDLIEDLNRILEADQILLEDFPGFRDPALAPGAVKQTETPVLRGYHIYRNRLALETRYGDFIEGYDYPPHRLLHVVNTTLNLVGGDNLAWQQRKAESFTVSPLHCGSYRVGYRRSRDYGGDDGISLGTAMAISGAAASSNMGYYTTSPVLSLVLTLFNVRLGWWLGNPGPAGSRSYRGVTTDDRPGQGSKRIYRRMSPTLSVGPVFSEAFGLTDDRSDYVYLTDGGHFENLGLYEMVLRRCQLIVVSDAAADAQYEFNDLANAVRKVRIDLGIHIEFPDVPIFRKAPDNDKERGCYWSLGLIRYSDMDYKADGNKAEDGILIYIKPAVYDDEPEDVMHYKRTHPEFPNETTADQFFDEPQFESYRALGSYIMDKMCGPHSGEINRAEFVKRVKTNFFLLAPQVKEKYARFSKIAPDDADQAPDPIAWL